MCICCINSSFPALLLTFSPFPITATFPSQLAYLLLLSNILFSFGSDFVYPPPFHQLPSPTEQPSLFIAMPPLNSSTSSLEPLAKRGVRRTHSLRGSRAAWQQHSSSRTYSRQSVANVGGTRLGT